MDGKLAEEAEHFPCLARVRPKDDFKDLKASLGKQDKLRLDEHLASVRDVERAISSLPPEYKNAQEPEPGGDVKDYPRIAKLQSDLLAYALARLAGGPPMARLHHAPAPRLHPHQRRYAGPAADPARHRRWHVKVLAYLIGKRA